MKGSVKIVRLQLYAISLCAIWLREKEMNSGKKVIIFVCFSYPIHAYINLPGNDHDAFDNSCVLGKKY